MQILPSSENPEPSEISTRLAAVRAEMAAQGLDFYLCHDPANIYYLTNFRNFVHERPFILLVPASGAPIFLCPKLEESHVRSRAVGELQLLSYFEFPAPQGQMWFDRMHEVLKPGHRVGVESLCPLAVFRQVPGAVVEIDIVDRVREIKSAYEINRLAYTSQWLSRGHARLLAAARPGAVTLALSSQISGALVGELLASSPHANALACEAIAIAMPPAFSHDPHLVPDLSCKLAEGGPHVTLLCGTANGYGAEVERTFFTGHVPEAAVRPFHAMLEARALGFELAVPGADMGEVDRKVNDLLKARGYGDRLLHRTGHSFGVTRHEAPFLAEGFGHEIKPGMLFSIEPGIYLPGIGGFRFSDTVLVTETGNLTLTQAPETLEALTLQVSA